MIEHVVVGLGNPGSQYLNSRHNVGFMVVDHLVARLGLRWKSGFKSEMAQWNTSSGGILLLKPQTFMNLSGSAVSEVRSFYKLTPEKILIVYDDMDIPFGHLRLRTKGGPGGHNGMKSIIQLLGTDVLDRVRVGVGRPENDARDHVLGSFSGEELRQLSEIVEKAAEAVIEWTHRGMRSAMNIYNVN